jgi:ribose-phosphate pyrophosphokinase
VKILSGTAHPRLAEGLAVYLGEPLGGVDIRRFPDGEVFVKIVDNIRGRDLYIVQPICDPPNENLMELLIMIDAAKRASAARITAVLPYFGYARQDRKDQPRVPSTAKLVANLLVAAGADRILTLDLHSQQIQGFFDIPVDHLSALPVLADHIRAMNIKDAVVVSPDVRNVKKATHYAQRLGMEIAVIDKRRVDGATTIAARVMGEVKGKTVLLFDDMITTAGTATEAIRLLREHGAKRFLVGATHAVLAGPAVERLAAAEVDWIFATDTIPLRASVRQALPQMTVLSVAKLLGEAIRRIHLNQSVSALFQQE